ncbi:hypothetical protein O59_002273 [Cellvibrio sp. BR]|uniref:hypothetical protein n=1 Tax=Cellvibrio sp. BR TaxID=1134474 RepID=UPI0002600BD6|nr:hypothetical protein [Cellvibrio sp. BR]EIK45595.1 hypothetical protein O59_002273 [Cellvibrio sp. BR]
MNKKIIASLLLSLSALPGLPAMADDLGINVILEGEVAPGVYGRVELGNDSRPNIYYREPMIIVSDSKYARSRPVYLHVPPGHAKNWGKHCSKYRACDRPVYFVRSAEYDEHYSDDHGHDEHKHEKNDRPGKGKGQGNGKGKGNNH